MGKTLDTLTRTDRGQPAKPKPAATTPAECFVEWTLGEESVPYIEVGGPKKVDLSPELIHLHPPQARPQRPHSLAEPTTISLHSRTPSVVDLGPVQPACVRFEAWPGTSTKVAAELVAYHQPEHTFSRAYAALADEMLARLSLGRVPALLVIGVKSGVGATTVLLNLAIAAATRNRQRVALLDANFARPAVAQKMGHARAPGIQQVFAGEAALEQTILKSAIPALHLLPSSLSARAATPRDGAALAWLVSWLRERYDLVLLDGPALDAHADLALLAPLCDGVYLVVPAEEDTASARTAGQRITQLGGELRGLLVSQGERF